MVIKNLNIYFFIFLLIVATVGGFLLIQPYVIPIFLAALFAVIFIRPYEFVKKKIHSASIASAIMLFVVAVTIILPVIFVSGLVYNEISDFVLQSTQQNSTTQRSVERIVTTVVNIPIMSIAWDRAEEYASGQEIANVVKNVANYSITLIQSAYRGLMSGAIGFFVMFFTLFYFFIDGKTGIKYIMRLSPLRDVHEKKLINEFISMARATLKGTVVIGILQGTIAGIAFAIAGVVSPILWTVIMIILSVIPAVGAALVIFPAAIIMLLLGHIWQAIFLAIIGFFVSTIDNFLRPKLVGKDTQMHSLAVFFATIGGLKLFGFVGFIMGPIIMALMIALWKIYAIEFKKDLNRFNV